MLSSLLLHPPPVATFRDHTGNFNVIKHRLPLMAGNKAIRELVNQETTLGVKASSQQ